MRNTHQIAPASLALLSLAAPALAQDAGDIGLTIVNGQLQTNLIAEEGSGGFQPQRLFLAEFGEVEFEAGSGSDGGSDVFQDNIPDDLDFVTNTPGFDTNIGALTPGTALDFTVRGGDLRVYDSATDSFLSTRIAPGDVLGESVGISFNSQAAQTNPTIPGDVDFPTLNVFADGRYHRHFTFTLLPVDDAASANPSFTGDDGVYYLDLLASSTDAGIQDSDPFGILLPFGISEDSAEFTAAVAAANRLVPEPTAALVLAGLGGALLTRRRSAAL